MTRRKETKVPDYCPVYTDNVLPRLIEIEEAITKNGLTVAVGNIKDCITKQELKQQEMFSILQRHDKLLYSILGFLLTIGGAAVSIQLVGK